MKIAVFIYCVAIVLCEEDSEEKGKSGSKTGQGGTP